MACGCEGRKNWLNEHVPGLGDQVEKVAKPVQERLSIMPEILRPDMKSLVWLALGAFVVPMILRKVR